MKKFYFLLTMLLAGFIAGAQITVDGNASDWSNATAIATETTGITSLKATNDADNLYFLVEGVIDVNNSFFFDSDNNLNTGFVNMQGYDYLIQNEVLYSYSGDGTNWDWAAVAGADTEWSGNTGLIEIRIAKANLTGLTNEIRVYFYTVSSAWAITGQIPANAVPVSWIAPNYENDLITYNFVDPVSTGTVNLADKTVMIDVPFGTDVTDIIANFTLSPDATTTVLGTIQVSGTTSNNFNNPVVYTVTAQNMTINTDWTVTVNVLPASSDATLSSLTSSEGTLNPNFASNIYSYTVELPAGTSDVPVLTAVPTDFDNATIDVVVATNLTGTQAERTTTITVNAQDNSTQDYTVEFMLAEKIETIASKGISVYPNPSRGEFTVNVKNNFNLEVIDVIGRVISNKVIDKKTIVNIEKPGIYFMKFSDEKSSVIQKIIVK